MGIFEQFNTQVQEIKGIQEQIDNLTISKNKAQAKENELYKIINQLSEFNINNIGSVLAYIVTNVEGFSYVYKSNLEFFQGGNRRIDNVIIREDITDCIILDGSNSKSNPLVNLKLIYFFENENRKEIIPFKDFFYKTNFEYLNGFIDMVIEAKYEKIKSQLPLDRTTNNDYDITLTSDELMDLAVKFLQSRNVLIEGQKLQRVQKGNEQK